MAPGPAVEMQQLVSLHVGLARAELEQRAPLGCPSVPKIPIAFAEGTSPGKGEEPLLSA